MSTKSRNSAGGSAKKIAGYKWKEDEGAKMLKKKVNVCFDKTVLWSCLIV